MVAEPRQIVPNNDYLSGADGLRGLACLSVIVVHSIMFAVPTAYPYIAGCGKLGVWLFFLLSAYLLTTRLSGGTPLSDYAFSRLLRIYPLYVLALALHWYLSISITNAQDFFN